MIMGCFRRAGRESIISSAVFYDTDEFPYNPEFVGAFFRDYNRLVLMVQWF